MTVKLYRHNKETYKRITEMFETDNRVGVVQPTGTGKSFLMLKWIEDNINDKIVVVSPSTVLFNQLYRYAKKCNLDISHVDMQTYQKLTRAEDFSIESLDADKIILDEFHRAGAEKWGESIYTLLDSHSHAQVLGLTATPIRYLDESKNMADEIFENNLARYMTLGEAVEQGILPVPKYVPVWYDYNKKLTEYQKDIKSIKNPKDREECERLLKELKNNLQNSYGAEDIFKDNMPTDHGKYIVFCKDIEHIELMKKRMKKWLKGVNKNITFYITHSERSDRDEQVQAFIDDNDIKSIKLLFSVNRLNEGLHVPGIDGVIMLRPTESGIIYLQQMGRSFATDNDTPIIFDMVNNYKNVKVIDPDNPEAGYQNIFEKDLYSSALFRKRNISNLIFGIFEDMKKFNEVFEHFESILYPTLNARWEYKFNLVKEFIKEFGRLPTKRDYYKDEKIGYWLRSNRKAFTKSKLSKERQEKLESLGVVFGSEDLNAIWNCKFNLLVEFIKEFGRLPKFEESYKGEKIGRWVTTNKQKFNNGKLSKERQEKLESLGVVFEKKDLNAIWEYKFNLLVEFIKEFGRLPKDKELYKGENIGSWMGHNKQKFNNGKLSKERQEKLESLGVVFKKKK